jgi:hypothetical protein
LTTEIAAWRAARHKHDSVDDVPIDARLIKIAKRKSKRIIYRARRRGAVCREDLWWAEQPFQPRVVLGITGIPPGFAGEDLDFA